MNNDLLLDKIDKYLVIGESNKLEKDLNKLDFVGSVYEFEGSIYIETGNIEKINEWLKKNKSKYKIKKITVKDDDLIKLDI